MKITLVAAVARNGVIGRDGQLPWRLPKDLRSFQAVTTGHCLVMGRKTFDSIGKPLPKRVSIVISRDPDRRQEGVVFVRSFDAALAAARERDEREVFVVGGAEIYALALPLADRLLLTRVHADVDGEAHFPPFEPASYELRCEAFHEADQQHAHAFSIQDWVRR